MQDILGHLDFPLLSIWTGAWTGRAGILAEMCSFFLIAPEILGAERLKGAEEALKKGLQSPFVLRGAVSVWTALFALLLIGPVPLVLILGRNLSLGGQVVLLAAIYVSAFSDLVCRFAVTQRPLPHHLKGGQMLRTLKRMASFSWELVNPFEFGRAVRPNSFQWVSWILGIPFHILETVPFLVAPAVTLALVRLGQNVLTGGTSLRTLVFGTGVVFLLGGILAQFVATF
jgi:hypothetical protein